MAKDLGKGVSHTYSNPNHAYDSVVFRQGKPPLDSEVNLSQQLMLDQVRKSTLDNSSGWVSFREPFAEPGNENFFYTQDPSEPLPEIALVNGWPVHVTNTHSTASNVNEVHMDEFPLVSGSRVDGVFLEVWRGLISDEMSGITTPTDLTKVGILRSVTAVDANTAWSCGDNGILLHTDNGGVTWVSKPTPTTVGLNDIKFITKAVGYAVGQDGTAFKTEDQGVRWTKLDIPVTDSLNRIFIVSPTQVYFVGDNGTILVSLDGFQFNLVVNTGGVSSNLNDVFFYNSSIGWAVGDKGAYLRTLDGGATWTNQRITVRDPSNPNQETTVTVNLNAVRFSNLSDGLVVGDSGFIGRATDGGIRWADISQSIYNPDSEGNPNVQAYTRATQNLNSLKLVNSYPLRISLSIRNTNAFRSATYEISPTELTLTYQDASDLTKKSVSINLGHYATDEDLVDAINNVIDTSTNEYVFNASSGFTETAYLAHDDTATIYGSESTEIRFSMGDNAWVVGDDGLVLSSRNGGASWEREESSATFNLYGVDFTGLDFGWVVGDQGEISRYTSSEDSWSSQDTDLVRQTQRKVFFNGNNASPASLNLRNDSIHPKVNKETAGRTQIQYRIRVVEGVDIASFRDAGLGSEYVYSKGPNGSVRAAGSYPFVNMGRVTGDFGLWRSLCRNTVDGYSYAIPMFLVSRRNQQAYNPDTNINGSSVDSVGAIRPDGLAYSDITRDDIVDIRRKTGNVDLASLLGESMDRLLSGTLNTSMVRDPARGGQVGSYTVHIDEFGSDRLESLANAEINAQAVGGFTGFAEGSAQDNAGNMSIPGISGPPSAAHFPTLTNGMYNHDPDLYKAFYSVTDNDNFLEFDGQDIPGYFTGMGTEKASFVFAEEGVQEGDGINYVIEGKYIDFGSVGLSKIPTIPLQVKNVVRGTPSSAYHYFGIDKGVDHKLVRRFSTGVDSYRDYIEASSTGFGGDQESNASSFRIHLYQKVEENTTEIKIPKNIEGYFVFAVKEIRNVLDGGVYRVANLQDRDGNDKSVLVVNLSSTHTVTKGSYIEIIAEVTTSENENLKSIIGQVTQDRGETVDAFRSPYLTVFDSSVKGVGKSYKSVILSKTASGGEVSFADGDKVVGVASMNYLEGDSKATLWLESSGSYTTAVVTRVEKNSLGYITKLVGSSFNDASVLVCVIQEISQFQNSSGSSSAVVSYKTNAVQTLQPLPSTMAIQILAGPADFCISSLGTGGGIPSDLFSNPLEHVPVYDDLINPSYFFNLYGLEFNSFLEEQGFVSLPFRVSRRPSGVITLGGSGIDRLGRTFYRTSSESMLFKTEGMSLGNPRKLMVPFLAQIKSQVTSPALYGEVVLAVVSSYENTSLANEISFGPKQGKAVISLYKVPGMPLVK